MKLHSSFMGFFDHELKRVIIWKRSLSLFPGKPLTPGFKLRGVKRISGRPHLDDHRIHSITFVHVELANEFRLLTIYINHPSRWPINIIYCGNPNTAKFNRRWFGCRWFGLGKNTQRKEKQNQMVQYCSFHGRKGLVYYSGAVADLIQQVT